MSAVHALPDASVRSRTYYVARATAPCPECGLTTRLLALALPTLAFTTGAPGMLLLHGNGNVMQRTLAPGEKILVEPGGFLYKDSSVQMQASQMPLKTGHFRHGMYLAEMTGPGRVGIQSMYVHHHAD